MPPRVLPVESGSRLAIHWPKILGEILKNVPFSKRAMITCCLYGEELSPTIVMMVNMDEKPSKEIAKARRGLEGLLKSLRLSSVKILFLKGAVIRAGPGSTGLLDPLLWSRRALMGQSMAFTGNTEVCGTMGGVFQIKLKGSTEWKTVAMTCFHVVIPPVRKQYEHVLEYWKDKDIHPRAGKSPDAMIEEWISKGIKPGDPNRTMLTVDHPASNTVRQANESFAEQMVALRHREFDKLVTWADEGLSMPTLLRRNVYEKGMGLISDNKVLERAMIEPGLPFGCVWAASGERTVHLHPDEVPKDRFGDLKHVPLKYTIDWALIDVPETRIPDILVSFSLIYPSLLLSSCLDTLGHSQD